MFVLMTGLIMTVSAADQKTVVVWTLDKGRFFYFQPGHETNPIFFNEEVRKIMANAVIWADGK